jgi:acetylornithine/succinyldiaminopimelate/putrescine aminotransferase
VQGEAGVRIADTEYLRLLRTRCSELGILLIFDEVQSGMGRCGSLFRLMQCGVVPDVLLTAKAFGGGLPLGAFIAGQSLMKVLAENPALGHITTFGGHPLSCATALTALRIINKEKLAENATVRSLQFAENLKDLPGLKEIRRCGLMMALDFGDGGRVEEIVTSGLKHGLLLDWFLFDEKSVRLAPPLTITEKETDDCCERFRQSCLA